MAGPILPRDLSDPTGQDRRERAAMADFARRFAAIGKAYQRALKSIPVESFAANAAATVALVDLAGLPDGVGGVAWRLVPNAEAKRYEFRLDEATLARMLDELNAVVDRLLLQGGQDQLWFSVDYVVPAYQQGSATTWANLSAQSTTYALARPQLEQVILSAPYARRLGMLRAREFELMQGLSAGVKQDMAIVLTDGVAAGLNPLTISKNLTSQLGIEKRRADRIARTEVTNALRQARMDEAQQAQQEFGLQTMLMHLSALSPTTRPDHRARHAKLYAIHDQRVWWATKPNSINCKCSVTEVLVDEKGNPLTPGIVERARRMLGK